MPPTLLIDPAAINLETVVMDIAAVEERIPQRYEMALLERVHSVDLEAGIAVGSCDLHDDAFWVRGHIPGRPLMPGVLQIEFLAQLCSVQYHCTVEDDRFFGFGAVDDVKFRGTVVPGDRLVGVTKVRELRSRRSVFDCQGFVDGRLVIEAVITGMPV